MALAPPRVDGEAHHHDRAAASSAASDSARGAEAPGLADAAATIDLGIDPSQPEAEAAWPLGATIAGRYEVRGVLGEGGMGTVYRAEQVDPVRRAVALKLVRAGADTRAVLTRFEGERQALALMDHPHIARVLDGGTAGAGHPFFVMELVDGVPWTDYLARHRVPLAARLRLFQEVCRAVQHAHQKGIIHRDLKPTNILVEQRDGVPVPKVIDFGLAKAVDGLHLTDASLLTAFGTVAGTPLYMAPEQAACASDIDTRADIYALGVILYETLTGSTPIRRESLQRATLDEVLRLVREEEPPTPSRRVSSSSPQPAGVAPSGAEPARLGRELRGDLDWIVMKALAKERDRRYDSAAALADDLEHYLRDEPVLAGPPSTLYRLGKFVRRHRGQVVAASLVVLTLLGGIIGTTWGLIRARAEHAVAVAQAKAAERRSAQNEKISAVLGAIFRDLDPRQLAQPGPRLMALLGERLDHAAEQIEGESIGDPLAVARMQMILAESQANLGHYNRAVALMTKARATLTTELGADDPLTLTSMDHLALDEVDAGHAEQAIPLLEETLSRRRRVLGPGHADTIDTLGNLAYAHKNAGHHERAIALFEEALAATRAHLAPGHPFEVVCLSNLAQCYRAVGRLAEAVRLHEQTVPLVRAKFGADHPDTVNALAGLASACQEAGQLDRAISLSTEALDRMQARLGPDHPETATLLANLAFAHRAAGQADRARPLLERALVAQEAKLGPDHPDTLDLTAFLAGLARTEGNLDRAITLDRKLVDARRRAGADAPELAPSLAALGADLGAAGRWSEAETPLREALVIHHQREPDAWATADARSLLGAALLSQGRLGEARPLLMAGFEGLKNCRGTPPPPRQVLLDALDRLIRLAEASNQPAEVQSWRGEKDRLALEGHPGPSESPLHP